MATSDSLFLPRTPAPSYLPSLDLNEHKTIAFKHPGYPDDFGQNVLLRLQAYDDIRGGIYHGTALVICGILAGNQWVGYLTTERDDDESGLSTVHLEDDSVLLHHEYYFYLPGYPRDAEPYTVYRSFRDWTFPHNHLPPQFGEDTPTRKTCQRRSAPPSASRFSVAIVNRDISCRLTDAADYVQAAHICPSNENPWFGDNDMSRYNENQALQLQWAIDDVSNGLVLRPDLHKAFDDRKFAIVPKQDRWVAHFFGRTNKLGALYQNQIIDIPDEVHPAFLLARLAWTIFPLIGNFLNVGVKRVLTIRVKEDTIKEVTGYHTEGDIHRFGEASKPSSRRGSESPRKSQSPTKRRAPTDCDTQALVGDIPTKRQCVTSAMDAPKDAAIEAGDADTCTVIAQPLESHASLPAPRPWDLASDFNDSDHSLLSRNSLDFALPTREDDSEFVRETKKFNRHIVSLKREWLLSQRPKDPSLYCCNYEQAERNAGKRSYGQGRPLCWRCLGYEYQEPLIDAAGNSLSTGA
jgi:hypothetical protein